MYYPNAKIYSDGSHYIAIPHTERKKKKRITVKEKEIEVDENMKPIKEEPAVIRLPNGKCLTEIEFNGEEMVTVMKKDKQGIKITKKEYFEKLYAEYISLRKAERREKITDKMKELLGDYTSAKNYVDRQLERKNRNLLSRRIRMTRKAYLQKFNYFCTFTYDDAKHTEETFRQRLKETLSNFSNRKGWRYIGVWERSPEKQRLHFHGIFKINEMVGELREVKDYSIITHSMQTTMQNTYFNERFGRTDFEELNERGIGEAIAYLLKYLEKSGEKIVYSKGLPQYFISDIMEEDIVCACGIDDRKLLLYDNFTCLDEGTVIGKVCDDVISQMRKSN